jgi:hypothetical protein
MADALELFRADRSLGTRRPFRRPDFDVRADTVLGAVGDIANRAGYRIKANEGIWAVRWTGAYRAKATTFDALADVLYGSGLCPRSGATPSPCAIATRAARRGSSRSDIETMPDEHTHGSTALTGTLFSLERTPALALPDRKRVGPFVTAQPVGNRQNAP